MVVSGQKFRWHASQTNSQLSFLGVTNFTSFLATAYTTKDFFLIRERMDMAKK
jgi:hypothetical protein